MPWRVRIYLTESMGGVLGANVMRDHNVVFDYDNHRVGFAEGTCDYKADILNAAPSGVEDAEVCIKQSFFFLCVLLCVFGGVTSTLYQVWVLFVSLRLEARVQRWKLQYFFVVHYRAPTLFFFV